MLIEKPTTIGLMMARELNVIEKSTSLGLTVARVASKHYGEARSTKKHHPQHHHYVISSYEKFTTINHKYNTGASSHNRK